MGAGQGYGICTAVYILVYSGYAPTLCVDSSVCLFVHCCIYSRRKGKGKREESQDVTEPEIPAIKKWLVGDCPT